MSVPRRAAPSGVGGLPAQDCLVRRPLSAPGAVACRWSPSLRRMRAVQITRFGGPEVLDVVDLPDPVPGDGQQLYEVSGAGVNFADTHHTSS